MKQVLWRTLLVWCVVALCGADPVLAKKKRDRAPKPTKGESPIQHYNTALSLFHDGRIPEAIEACKKSIKIENDNAVVWNQLGLCYFALGDWRQALKAYDKALDLSPVFTDVYNNRGMVHHKMGEVDKARTDFETVLRDTGYAYPEMAYFNLGLVDLSEGNLALAEAEFKKAAELNPGFWRTHYQVGRVYEMRENYPETLKWYERAYERAPDSPELCYFLGRVLFKLENWGRAHSLLEQAIKIDPATSFRQQILQLLLQVESRLPQKSQGGAGTTGDQSRLPAPAAGRAPAPDSPVAPGR